MCIRDSVGGESEPPVRWWLRAGGLGAFEQDGLPLKLTGLEWRVLSCLMLNHETVVPRPHLIERVYEGDADVDSNSVEVIITRLRRKIAPARIESVRGHGYRLHADPA